MSWADMITLAGYVALEQAGGHTMPFCPGRSDAEDGEGSVHLQLSAGHLIEATPHALRQWGQLMGLTVKEMVAVMGVGPPRVSVGWLMTGYRGNWTTNPTRLGNEYFQTLVSETWEKYTVPATNMSQYRAKRSGGDIFALPIDVAILMDPALKAIAQDYAADEELFLLQFAAAWVKMANADRFDGPAGNLCDKAEVLHPAATSLFRSTSSKAAVVVQEGVDVPLASVEDPAGAASAQREKPSLLRLTGVVVSGLCAFGMASAALVTTMRCWVARRNIRGRQDGLHSSMLAAP